MNYVQSYFFLVTLIKELDSNNKKKKPSYIDAVYFITCNDSSKFINEKFYSDEFTD